MGVRTQRMAGVGEDRRPGYSRRVIMSTLRLNNAPGAPVSRGRDTWPRRTRVILQPVGPQPYRLITRSPATSCGSLQVPTSSPFPPHLHRGGVRDEGQKSEVYASTAQPPAQPHRDRPHRAPSRLDRDGLLAPGLPTALVPCGPPLTIPSRSMGRLRHLVKKSRLGNF